MKMIKDGKKYRASVSDSPVFREVVDKMDDYDAEDEYEWSRNINDLAKRLCSMK